MRRGECQVSSDGWTETKKTIKKNLRLLALCAMLLALSSSADAQQPKKIPRIGYLTTGSLSSASENVERFRQGLRELGYVEGKTITIEYRYAGDKLDGLPDLAAELVQLKVELSSY